MNTQRIRLASRLLDAAAVAARSDDSLELAQSLLFLCEAIVPKFDVNIKPYTHKESSEIIEKKAPKIYKSATGLISNLTEQSVENGTHNILVVFDRAKNDLTKDEFDFWSKWYKHAHKDVQRLASKYDLPLKIVAGVVAVLSPNTSWNTNLTQAEKVIRLGSTFIDYEERQKLEKRKVELELKIKHLKQLEKDWLKKIRKEKLLPGSPAHRKLEIIQRHLVDKRTENRAFLSKYKQIVKDHVESLEESSKTNYFMRSYTSNIRKALMILATDNEDTVYVTGPKVEAFYHALMEPEDNMQREMVIDGHAVNIWLGEKNPLKGTPKPLGSRRAKILQSYADAAQQRSTTPQAIQAVTWYFWKRIVDDAWRDVG